MNIPKEIQESRIAWAANDAKRDSGLQEPQGIEKFCDLDYAGDGITEHLLDVYRPVQNGENLPVLISIHGGGWFYGDKELYRFYCMHMAELGFVVVNCNYRLAPEHPYPAAIADVCQAIRWTLAHRKQYTSNPHWFLAVSYTHLTLPSWSASTAFWQETPPIGNGWTLPPMTSCRTALL